MSTPHDSESGNPVRRPNRFPGKYRLKKRRHIRPLFERDRADIGSLAVGCVRLIYRVISRQEVEADVPIQVGFAPGRGTRKAVERNRVKRILREVYRVHQRVLVDLFLRRGDTLTLMILFRGKFEESAACISRDLPEAIHRMVRRMESSRMTEQ